MKSQCDARMCDFCNKFLHNCTCDEESQFDPNGNMDYEVSTDVDENSSSEEGHELNNTERIVEDNEAPSTSVPCTINREKCEVVVASDVLNVDAAEVLVEHTAMIADSSDGCNTISSGEELSVSITERECDVDAARKDKNLLMQAEGTAVSISNDIQSDIVLDDQNGIFVTCDGDEIDLNVDEAQSSDGFQIVKRQSARNSGSGKHEKAKPVIQSMERRKRLKPSPNINVARKKFASALQLEKSVDKCQSIDDVSNGHSQLTNTTDGVSMEHS